MANKAAKTTLPDIPRTVRLEDGDVLTVNDCDLLVTVRVREINIPTRSVLLDVFAPDQAVVQNCTDEALDHLTRFANAALAEGLEV